MEKTSFKKIMEFRLWHCRSTGTKKPNWLLVLSQILSPLLVVSFLNFGCKKKSDDSPSPFLGITVYNDFKTHPDTFIFKAESTIPCNYKWNFADGSTEVTGDSVMHLFDYGFFNIVLKGETTAGKTATTIKGINASPYTKANIINFSLNSWPVHKSDGTAWDSDGSAADIYCQIWNGNTYVSTTVSNNAPQGTAINFNFITPFAITQFDKSIIIKVFNYNLSPETDDLMETVVIEKNLTPLMTNQLPYAVQQSFSGSQTNGTLSFIWQ